MHEFSISCDLAVALTSQPLTIVNGVISGYRASSPACQGQKMLEFDIASKPGVTAFYRIKYGPWETKLLRVRK